jgi:hypothetical protein
MKKLILSATLATLLLSLAATADAGPLRKLLGRGKAAAGKVAGCVFGRCG